MSSEFSHRARLVLNVFLAITAVVLAFHRSGPVPGASVVEVIPVETTGETPFTVEPGLIRYPDTASAQLQRKWLVDQLRAMGVPNKVLARVVWADIDWKVNQRGGELSLKSHGDPDTMAAYKLENAMNLDAEMRAALGEEGFKQWDYENLMREANQGKIELTPSETDTAYDLWKKVQQRELELRKARLEGEMDEADVGDAIGTAISEFKQQMKSLLGDERYAKSQQIDDGTAAAASLRQDFAKANPSDSQFLDLLKTQQQWNEHRMELDKQFENGPSSPAYAEQIKALEAARDQEYRRVLGPDVFDAYQKEQDLDYIRMKKYANNWALDDDKIDSVYGTLKYYQKSVEDYQSQARALEAQGQSVDWDGVKKNLKQFADQIQQTLQNYLGQDSFNRLQRNGIFELSSPPGYGRPSQ